VVLLSDVLWSRPGSGTRPFKTDAEIKEAIELSKNFDHDGSDPRDAFALLFFDTSLQHTWLVKTKKRLYCILDDIRKPAPHVNWSMPMSEVLDQNGNVKLDVKARDRVTKSQASGKLDFGPNHRNWLFSTKLFTIESAEETVKSFLKL